MSMIKGKNRYPVQAKGFALVLSLVLMAFLLMLMLSLSALTMVELATSQTLNNKTKAERNALFGLQIALGQLQETAGPDQRTTARADILADRPDDAPHADRLYWTGVWNTDSTHPEFDRGERIDWLVSGHPDPDSHQQASSEDEVILVGEGSVPSGQEIKLPRITISNDTNGISHYAYWIGDEGIKARYNLPETPPPPAAGYNTSAVAPSRLGLSTLADFANTSSQAEDNVVAELPRVLGHDSLPLLHPNLTVTSSSGPDKRNYFHDLTFHSQGVLTDTRNGGLKYDLTTAFEDDSITLPDLGADLPDLELFRDYYRLKDLVSFDGDRFSIEPRVQTGTQHEVKPLLVLFQGNFGVLPSDLNGEPVHHPNPVAEPSNLIFTMRPTIVMANPYDLDLAPADYDIIWEPEAGSEDLVFYVGIQNQATKGVSARMLKPFDLLGGRLHLKIENEGFRAGEVKVFTLADDGLAYAPEAKLENSDEIGRYFWIPTAEVIPAYVFEENAISGAKELRWNNQLRIRFHYSGNNALQPASTRFSLLLNNQEASVHENVFSGNRQWIGKISSQFIEFWEAFDYGYHARFKLRPSQRGRNNFPVGGDITGSGSDARGMPWLANINIRSPRTTDLKDTFTDFSWNSHPAFYWDGHNTGWLNESGGTATPQGLWNIQTSDGGRRTSWGTNPAGSESPEATPGGTDFVTLYHVPRSPLLSLGQLKHANASPEYAGTYSVGQSWASMFLPFEQKDFHLILNEAIWDRYYLSGYRDGAFLNPRLQPIGLDTAAANIDMDDPEQVAGALMIQGAFNINSTSVEAWRSILASLREQSLLVFNSGDNSTPLQAESHTETPFPSSTLPAGFPMPERPANPNLPPSDEQLHSQWNGYRTLTDAQIETLAGQIVHQVRMRGPFLSLADFVNRDHTSTESGLFSPRMMGALQAAIDNTEAAMVNGITYQYQTDTVINFHAPDAFLRLNPVVGQMGADHFPESNRVNPLPNDEAINGLSAERDAPGYLSQSDILSMIGSFISARSDTFRIRSYGDWENPVTGSRSVAVCEAVVRRLPTPVSPDNNSPLEPDEATRRTLGRQFEIISFRWLSQNEI